MYSWYFLGKKKKFIIPEPPPILEIDDKIEASLKAHNKTLMQYKRLTIELKELEDLHKVSWQGNQLTDAYARYMNANKCHSSCIVSLYSLP